MTYLSTHLNEPSNTEGFFLFSDLKGPSSSFLAVLSRKRIDLKSMLGVYVVMGVGMLVAFFVLIAEIMWKRREKLKLINTKQRFVAG